VVERKKRWILKNQNLVREKASGITAKEFVTGKEFWYLGEIYKLHVINNHADSPLTFNNGFYLSHSHLNEAREIFIHWYRERAGVKIAERVNHYSLLSGLRYNRINITNAQRRWGSCSNRGNLSFSWRAVMAPLSVIDYLAVHELVHTEEMNHSTKFWSKVKALFPDYEQQKKWLRDNHQLLSLF
jgi:predicted metal-dependent hydrolase